MSVCVCVYVCTCDVCVCACGYLLVPTISSMCQHSHTHYATHPYTHTLLHTHPHMQPHTKAPTRVGSPTPRDTHTHNPPSPVCVNTLQIVILPLAHTSTHPHVHTPTHPHTHTPTHPQTNTSTHPHLVTAFNNDWLSHKYNNGSSISMSRSARKNAANSGRFRPI